MRHQQPAWDAPVLQMCYQYLLSELNESHGKKTAISHVLQTYSYAAFFISVDEGQRKRKLIKISLEHEYDSQNGQ